MSESTSPTEGLTSKEAADSQPAEGAVAPSTGSSPSAKDDDKPIDEVVLAPGPAIGPQTQHHFIALRQISLPDLVEWFQVATRNCAAKSSGPTITVSWSNGSSSSIQDPSRLGDITKLQEVDAVGALVWYPDGSSLEANAHQGSLMLMYPTDTGKLANKRADQVIQKVHVSKALPALSHSPKQILGLVVRLGIAAAYAALLLLADSWWSKLMNAACIAGFSVWAALAWRSAPSDTRDWLVAAYPRRRKVRGIVGILLGLVGIALTILTWWFPHK